MTTTHEKSSGNVFTDLGLPNSEQELLKAKLTVQIYRLIKECKLTHSLFESLACRKIGGIRYAFPPYIEP